MCGRFTQTFDENVFDYFPVFNSGDLTVEKTFNAAPTQKLLAIAGSDGKYKAGYLKWGLVPSWTSALKGSGIINARAETVTEKPSFKHLIDRKRCLILADSFYEWQNSETGKIPYRFLLRSEEPFAFAGLWDRWRKDGKDLVTCTIITTKANGLVHEVHDRMPVIFKHCTASAWLDMNKEKAVEKLLPIPEKEMKAYQVSSKINSPAINEASCTFPV
ncbi:SOS response-associated peptidase [Metabacillus sp. KIGAM252]|uniref:Abasic site processing protein n=1 Tax=Metabacillus flavus TaxID=2823519 RepID=A0ABS5LFE0_9BACI|nr:SOS response-associated peptidase [Metabacillus flavus]MBS2969308.1 SOS response-associated peptidase [Metabacillus flavus]